MTADKCREKKFMRAFMHISEKLPFNQNEYFLSAWTVSRKITESDG